jgi:hypothetical protein
MIDINDARCDSSLVVPWALELLQRVKVPPSDPRAGISHPTDLEADALAESFRDVEVVLPRIWWISSADANEQRRCEAAKVTAERVFAAIPILPQFVGLSESVNALADTSASAAEWANQRQIMTQLADAANLTILDLRQGTPWVAVGVGAVALLLLLRR